MPTVTINDGDPVHVKEKNCIRNSLLLRSSIYSYKYFAVKPLVRMQISNYCSCSKI